MNLHAEVVLPALIADHMVLQQNQEVVLWGTAKALEPVKVKCSWSSEVQETKGDPYGNWQVKVKTPMAGGPYTIDVNGYNHIHVEDVWIGEVWLCSGQSNMEWSPRMGVAEKEEMLAGGNQPMIRFFKVMHRTSPYPQMDTHGKWELSTSQSLEDFSAVAYHFARHIRKHKDVPFGLILSAWGGTPAETWVSKEALEANVVVRLASKKLFEVEWGPVRTGETFNAMINPLIPYKIAGAIWYQGESNANNGDTYDQLLETLITDWRTRWGYEFPFYFVQIAPFRYGVENEGVIVQDAQRKATRIPKTGIVITNDIGNPDDIHPLQKREVGERLGNHALHDMYGFKDVHYQSPLYSHMEKVQNKIRIHFHHAGNKLQWKNEPTASFLIAGNDQKFYPAEVRLEGKTVLVFSNDVQDPVAVRFAWSNISEPGLMSDEGLPVSCFRTDDWPVGMH